MVSGSAPAVPSIYDSGLAAIRSGQSLIAASGAEVVAAFSPSENGPGSGDAAIDAIRAGLTAWSGAEALDGPDAARGAINLLRGEAQVQAGIALIAVANHNAQVVIDLIDPDRHRCDCKK